MDLSQKIRFLREKRGLKQINLANALQVSPQAVSKWERGASCPDLQMLIRIARLFDTTTDFLLGLTERGSGVFEATVLCTSIIDFARRSVSMDSRELADYANMIFYPLTESVLAHDGIPVKYVGDGFLCFFSGASHRDRAIGAALHAKKTMNQKDLVIALDTGDIYLGLLGHPEYAMRDIIGKTVNRAFLVAGWVSAHCLTGIGATGTVIQKAEGQYPLREHRGVEIALLDEALDIFELGGTP